jgi:hypothetical protein
MRRSGVACAVSLFLYSAMLGRPLQAQTPAATSKASTATQPGSSSAGLGFSMESEMLTYSAMDRNSQAIACDVAFYVYGEESRKGIVFSPDPPNLDSTGSISVVELCRNAKSWADAKEQPRNSIDNDGIVILQADSSVQSGLELWRTYMAEMQSLKAAGAKQGCTNLPGAAPNSSSPKTSFETRYWSPQFRFASLGLSEGFYPAAQAQGSKPPAKAAVAPMNNVEGAADLAEQIVSANDNAEAVRGTVESQTFVNTIAGELRVLGIPVLMPETSMPHAMSSQTHYVVLDEAQELADMRTCLKDKAAAGADGKNGTAAADDKNASDSLRATSLLNDIDSFLAAAFSWSGITAPVGRTTAFKVSQDIQNLLSSDLLAQELRIGLPDGSERAPESSEQVPGGLGQYRWNHILWVRALESGGSVIKRERFWGSKIRYSGGSIVTYALVMMDGPLECSGSFYDYGGPLSGKDFQKKGTPTLAAKIPVSGGCRALVQRQNLSGPHH